MIQPDSRRAAESPPSRLVLPPALVEEALTGGFTSLWLPVELAQTNAATGQRLDCQTGSRFLTIGLCLTGRGHFRQSHRHWEIQPGQVWLAQPGLPWSFATESDQPCAGWQIVCAGSRIPWFRTMLLKDDQEPVFFLENPATLVLLLEEIRSLLVQGWTKRNLDCATLVLGHFMARLAQSRQANRTRPADSQERINQSLEYLEHHLSEDIRVGQLAALANLSESRYASLFREHTGRTVLDFHNACRMAKAQELLRSGDLAVKDVATTLGYHDQLYFSRIFKKYIGHAPSETRNTPG